MECNIYFCFNKSTCQKENRESEEEECFCHFIIYSHVSVHIFVLCIRKLEAIYALPFPVLGTNAAKLQTNIRLKFLAISNLFGRQVQQLLACSKISIFHNSQHARTNARPKMKITHCKEDFFNRLIA